MILANQSGRSRNGFVFIFQTLAILALILSAASVPLRAQNLTLRIKTTNNPSTFAINPVTNKIYVG
jgi:hypothetical protein